MLAPPWSSSPLSCGERLLLTCDGNSGNSFPNTQGKDPSSRARRRKHGSSECGLDSRASSRVETCMSWNFLSCSKGVKEPLEVPEFRCDYPRDASVEMGLISHGQHISGIFSSFGKCSRLTMGGPALVASGKASPHASCSGASRHSSPFDAGA